mgnify:CR=1 FL=1
MKVTYLISAVSALALLGACSNTDLIEQTEKQTPTGSNFAKGSYSEYLELAKSEESQGDHSSAKHYLTKAGLSATGKEVGPDDPALRNIAGPEEAPIKAGYDKLNTALKAGAGDRKPAEAAKAQAMLDCWMEQSEEGVQPDHIKACRTGFEKSLAALGDTATSADKAMPPSGSPFTVYFKNNSMDLTEKSHGDLFDILQKIRVYKPKAIAVSVYSDLTGSAAYNKDLAEKRGKMLAGELKSAGGKNITVNAVGAASPLIDKPGKVDANRRAVISFKKK